MASTNKSKQSQTEDWETGAISAHSNSWEEVGESRRRAAGIRHRYVTHANENDGPYVESENEQLLY